MSISAHFQRIKQARDDMFLWSATSRTQTPLTRKVDDHDVLGNYPRRSNIYCITKHEATERCKSLKEARMEHYAKSGITTASRGVAASGRAKGTIEAV